MTRTILTGFAILLLIAGCSSQQGAVPEPIARHLAMPLEHSVPYDVEVTSRLGKFLVTNGYYVPWTSDGTTRIYDHDIRLNSYTTLPNGSNVPYTLSDKAKPYVHGKDLHIAMYQVEKVLSVKMKKPPKAVRGKVERYGLRVEYKVTPLLTGIQPVKNVTGSVDVDYDLQSGKVLQVAGLTGIAHSVRKAVEKSLKNGT